MNTEQLRELLNSMSLKEKVFQLVQIRGQSFDAQTEDTGTDTELILSKEERALAGSTLGVFGAEKTRAIQLSYMEKHPHHIPLLFMHDVIHGLRTAFPMPLGLGASFSPELVYRCAAAAAEESVASGLHVTFAPMLDLVRDPRWGRVMESFGEDPFLNGEFARAAVQGFRGGAAAAPAEGRIASCIKHFAAYGAAEAGRDYSGADISRYSLQAFYLPSYRKGVDAGTDLVMTSFNLVEGVPSSANEELLRRTLRENWGFDGVLISDWNAVGELVSHGVCRDLREAAKLAMQCGVDIDMCSLAYPRHLEALVADGEVGEDLLDAAVLRVLELKNRLGLFEDPFRGASPDREKRSILCAEHRALAREAVCESAVLLKNAGEAPPLPLSPSAGVLFAGPYVGSRELHSAWAVSADPSDAPSIRHAAEALSRSEGWRFRFEEGCPMTRREDLGPRTEEVSVLRFRQDLPAASGCSEAGKPQSLQQAAAAAEQADVVVACLGEHRLMSGEGASRGELTLPEPQLELLRGLHRANGNVVSVIFTGRPLDLREVCALSRSVLLVWMPGTEGGGGILDLLTGRAEPGGRLTMTVPYCVGQVPVYYNRPNTGRPKPEDTKVPRFISAYIDIPNSPLFPFGYGLGYTTFSVSAPKLSADHALLRDDGSPEPVTAGVVVRNTGSRRGQTVVQLYIRRPPAAPAAPVKELRAFRKVTLDPGEERAVDFQIGRDELCRIGADGACAVEKGDYRIWIGLDSETDNQAVFSLRQPDSRTKRKGRPRKSERTENAKGAKT